MAKKRVLLLAASVGSGHLVAARALENEFRTRREVEVANFDALRLTNEAYRASYDQLYQLLARRFPKLLGWTYDSADVPFAGEELTRKLWDSVNTAPLQRFICEYDPDITVCTHFMPAGVVSQLLAEGELRTSLAVVTTDYDFQGLWLYEAFTRFFVAREETRARMLGIGLPPERVTVSGIPINPRFAEPVDRAAVLARYELRPDLPVIVISAGAVGGGPARDLVAESLRLETPVQIVVVCGRNEELLRDVQRITRPRAALYRPLGFTTDMPDLVRVATLFVGKPGGLTSAECMAAGTPLVINTPTPGQEERNSDTLLEAGAAVRVNYVEAFAFKIDTLLNDPARLEAMRANARRMGRPDAARVIVDATLAETLPVVRFSRSEQQAMTERATSPARALLSAPPTAGALYDDDTGVFIAEASEAEYRRLRRTGRALDAPDGTLHIDTLRLEELRTLGLKREVLAALEQRLAARGPFDVRYALV
jgi:processive 1,2-diacylglycerol beta-glucosyltransferase